MSNVIYNLCSELKDEFDKEFEWTKSNNFIEIKVILVSKEKTGGVSPCGEVFFIAEKQYSSGDIQLVQKKKKSLVIEELEKYVRMYINSVLARDPFLDKEKTFINIILKSGIITFKSQLAIVSSDKNILKTLEIEEEKKTLDSLASVDSIINKKAKRI